MDEIDLELGKVQVELKRTDVEAAKLHLEQTRADSWSLCCSRSSPEAIKYFVHVAMALITISFSIAMIVSLPEGSDKTVYWSSLSATLGWVMPSPSLPDEKRAN
jgi:hypothetical protein